MSMVIHGTSAYVNTRLATQFIGPVYILEKAGLPEWLRECFFGLHSDNLMLASRGVGA